MCAATITAPDNSALDELCAELAQLSRETDISGDWPSEQLRLCGEYGVYEWFLEPQWGGQNWAEDAIVEGYLALSSACLTTTFIITQRTGACRRIAGSEKDSLKELLLPDLASGDSFATVGISHLTTSRRHLAKPVLRARSIDGGYVLDGFSPWVTGAPYAEHIVTGAVLMDGETATEEQLLVVLPTDLPGVSVPPPEQLVGVSASHTGRVELKNVEIEDRWVLAGPMQNVMSSGIGAGTGGYQTSTLALGLARSAIDFMDGEANKRTDLEVPLEALRQDYDTLREELFATVAGSPTCSSEELRKRANSLVLRATQSSLATAKGTGYVLGHPAGRWCREALFFLVWSCPQPVLSANLCELAGLTE